MTDPRDYTPLIDECGWCARGLGDDFDPTLPTPQFCSDGCKRNYAVFYPLPPEPAEEGRCLI